MPKKFLGYMKDVLPEKELLVIANEQEKQKQGIYDAIQVLLGTNFSEVHPDGAQDLCKKKIPFIMPILI